MNQSVAEITELEPASHHDLTRLIEQLETILLGKRQQIVLAVSCLLARGHLLIEDVPGVGKTTLAQALGACLDMPWNRIQFTSDLLPADVVGASIFNSNTHSFDFKPGPVFTSILLADEINRAPPKAQSALLEAMEERQVSVDGNSYTLDEEFFVIATQNSAEQLGAFPLPESQLDRFLVGIQIGYPNAATERQLLESGDKRENLAQLSPIGNADQLKQWQRSCEQVHIADTLFDYIQALLLATRNSPLVAQGRGLSPRAGLSLVRLIRAHATVCGRNHALPDDVLAVFPALAGHRLCGRVAPGYQLANEILEQVAMP